MQGRITGIQPFSVHDGPGIRTTVFLKGCNLRCFWCHNPEAMRGQRQIRRARGACIGCGACLAACPLAREGRLALDVGACIGCGACADACYPEALTLVGRDVDAEELVAELCADRDAFDRSGGGVTFSGGEPLLQPAFLADCLRRLRASGVHTAVETAACVPWAHIERALPDIDLVLCDLKSMDGAALRASTGADIDRVLANIRGLSASGVAWRIRVPVIPGFNDAPEDMVAIAAFLRELPRVPPVELLPFHNLCGGKYDALGWAYPAAQLTPPTSAHMASLVRVLTKCGIPATGE